MEKSKKWFFVIPIILLIIVVIIIVVLQKNPLLNQESTSISDSPRAQLYYYSGTVENIQGNIITFSSEEPVKATYQVSVDGISIQSSTASPSAEESSPSAKPRSLTDIKIGQKLLVVSPQNPDTKNDNLPAVGIFIIE